MKKNVRKVLATVAVASMGVASLAGCTKTPKTSSMTDVMNIASELDSYSYNYKYSMTADGETMEVELYGDCTKDAVSMSVKVEYDDMDLDYEAKDVMIATTDALYINLAEIEDVFLDGMDLGTYGLDAKWLKLEYGTEVEVADATSTFNTMFEDIEDAYGDLIEKDGKEYVITVDDNDTAQEFLELTADMIEDNQDDWADMFVSSYDSFDYETFLSTFMNNLFMEMNRTFDLGLTSSDISSAVDEVLADVDFEELEADIDESYYSEMFEDLVEELRYMADEVDIEAVDGEIELKAHQDGSEYVTSFYAAYDDGYDDFEVEFVSTITSEKVSVKAPSDDVMTVEEAICAALETFDAEIYADDAEELIEEMLGSLEYLYYYDIEDIFDMGYYGDDYWDDYYDDYYYDDWY